MADIKNTDARILIVEDDGIIAAHLETILTGLGYDVLGIAASGEDALQKVEEMPPDLVLMDIKLAGKMTGIETAAQIQASCDLPVVYLSGHAEEMVLQEAKLTAPYGYLVKPFQDRELRATIEMALHRHKLETQLREYRDHLEVLVEKRTVELTQANKQLQQEITERKQAEEDLEKFRDHLEELVTERTAELTGANDQLQREIAERVQAEEALGASEKRYRVLVENAAEGVFVIQDEVVRFANPKGLEILGKSEDEIVGRWGLDFVHPEDRQKLREIHSRRTSGAPTQQEYEYRILDKAGSVRWLQANTVTIEWAGRLAALTLVTDITERKRAEEALRESELRFRSLIEQTTDAVFCYECDPPIPTDLPIDEQVKELYRCVLVECNDVCARSYGYTRAEEVVGKKLTDLFGTASGSLDGLFTALIQGGYRIVDGLGTEVLEDGTRRYYLNNGHGVLENGMLVRVWGTFRDITERKRAEEALRESEERFAKAFHSSPNLMAITRMADGRIVDVNDSFIRTVGYRREELIGRSTVELGLWAKPEERNRVVKALQEYKHIHNLEVQIRSKSGETRVVLFSGEVINLHNEPHLITVASDITERKQAEVKLQEREETLRALINAPTESAMLVDLEGTILAINEVAAQRLGKSTDELVGLGMYDYLPPDLAESRKAQGDEVVRSGKPIRFQDERAGRYFDNNIYPVFDVEGKVTAIAVYARDITENKQAEEALHESETRFRALSSATSEGIAFTEQGIIVDANPQFAEMLGYEMEETQGMDVRQLVAPEDRELVRNKILAGREEPYEHRAIRKDGTIIFVEVRPRMMSIKGRPVRVTAIRDITARKRAEDTLRESEEKFRTLAETAPVGILITLGRKFLYVNPVAEQILGYNEEELLSLSPFDLIHPDFRDIVVKRNRERMAGNEVSPKLEIKIITKTGQERWVEGAAALINVGEQPTTLTVLSDITERKRAEEEREKLIAELQEALDRVKLLSGLLPICANCKKIRNDEGYWQDVAVYVRDHSEADFSHGICPDCMKALYPDFYEA